MKKENITSQVSNINVKDSDGKIPLMSTAEIFLHVLEHFFDTESYEIVGDVFLRGKSRSVETNVPVELIISAFN